MVSCACVPFRTRTQVCRLQAAPPRQTPSESTEPKLGSLAAPQVGPPPPPPRRRGRGITIATAQLGRVAWPGRIRLKGFTSKSTQMCAADRPPEAGSERSLVKTTPKLRESPSD